MARIMLELIYFVFMVIYTAESAFIVHNSDIDDYVLSAVQLETVIVERRQHNLRPSKLLVRKKQVWKGVDVWDCGGTWRQKFNRTREKLITGKLAIGIEKDLHSTTAAVSVYDAYETAKKHVRRLTGYRKLSYIPSFAFENFAKKHIHVDETTIKARLAYTLEFLIIKNMKSGNKVTNAVVKIDANKGLVIDANVGYSLGFTPNGFEMKGAGGNTVIGKYTYGEGLWTSRSLKVDKMGEYCVVRNDDVRIHTCVIPELPCSQYERICNYQPPKNVITETVNAQVNDAFFMTTHFLKILNNKFNDRILKSKENNDQLTINVFFPDVHKYASYGNRNLYFGSPGPDTVGMVAASTLGHELGHALLGHTSNLGRDNQPGAIAESFCDLCGQLLKASLNDYKVDWLFGSEVVRNNYTGRALRYMNNPPLDGESIDHAKDFKCSLDVHFGAGVYNKAIYNLSKKEGWSITRIFQIFHRTNQFFWREKTGFDEGLCGLLKCAEDFEYKVQDIADAFASVGVFCELRKSNDDRSQKEHSGKPLYDACPTGWTERIHEYSKCRRNFRSRCYKICNEEVSWAEAFSQCQSMKAKLLSVRSEDTSTWIKYELGLNGKKSYWLGATDLKVEQQWTWVNDDVPVEFHDWHQKPRDAQLRNCMALVKIKRDWGWQDAACSQLKRFICEIS